jgi:hypothetical protein
MSKVEEYELLDKVIEKEKNTKKLDSKEITNDFKGGAGFVCEIGCKKCGEAAG